MGNDNVLNNIRFFNNKTLAIIFLASFGLNEISFAKGRLVFVKDRPEPGKITLSHVLDRDSEITLKDWFLDSRFARSMCTKFGKLCAVSVKVDPESDSSSSVEFFNNNDKINHKVIEQKDESFDNNRPQNSDQINPQVMGQRDKQNNIFGNLASYTAPIKRVRENGRPWKDKKNQEAKEEIKYLEKITKEQEIARCNKRYAFLKQPYLNLRDKALSLGYDSKDRIVARLDERLVKIDGFKDSVQCDISDLLEVFSGTKIILGGKEFENTKELLKTRVELIANNSELLKEIEGITFDLKDPLENDRKLAYVLNKIAQSEEKQEKEIAELLEREQKEAKSKQDALEDANKKLSDRGYFSFCSDTQDLATINNVFYGLVYGQKTKEAAIELCSDALAQLHERNEVKRSTATKFLTAVRLRTSKTEMCIKSMLKACMNPVDYADDLAASLHAIDAGDSNEIFTKIEDTLRKDHKDQENNVWGKGKAHFIDNNAWILNTPQYTNLERTALNKGTHTETFLNAWRDTIASAEKFADISTLSMPESKFKEAFKDAVKALHEKNKPIDVRIIFGTNSSLVQQVDPDGLLKYLTEDLADSQLKISIAYNHSGYLMSWNHSKIGVVDGKEIVIGGHNFYTSYLESKRLDNGEDDAANVTHDLSMRLKGDIAKQAHQFLNKLWDDAKRNVGKMGYAKICTFDRGVRSCNDNNNFPANFNAATHALASETSDDEQDALFIGRLGDAGAKADNPSDTAIVAMLDQAKESIFISQQAFLYLFLPNTFNTNTVNALARAIMREVNIYIITSGTDERYVGLGNFGYSSGYDRENSAYTMFNALKALYYSDYKLMNEKLLKHFHILPAATMAHEVPNHAKLVVVDGEAALVTSHNLYDQSHGEGGVLAARPAAKALLKDYFAPFWLASLSNKVDLTKVTKCNYTYTIKDRSPREIGNRNYVVESVTKCTEDKFGTCGSIYLKNAQGNNFGQCIMTKAN